MYTFKRVIQYLKRKVLNKVHPEGSICAAYLVKFYSFYFEDDIPTVKCALQNDDGGPRGRPGCLSMFYTTWIWQCLHRMIIDHWKMKNYSFLIHHKS